MSERLTLKQLAEFDKLVDCGYFNSFEGKWYIERCVGDLKATLAEVRALLAEREDDDARLLRLEWSRYNGFGTWICPCCGSHRDEGSHCFDCDLGKRCDEARARKAARDE